MMEPTKATRAYEVTQVEGVISAEGGILVDPCCVLSIPTVPGVLRDHDAIGEGLCRRAGGRFA
jgi:hypothetical protein